MSQPLPSMDPSQTTEALWTTCGEWSSLADRFQRLADEGFHDGSRAQLDTAAAAVVDPPPAVSHYLKERAWNAARMLRALNRWVFDTETRRLHLDATIMYPLMRATLEDAATIVWLQDPSERDVRLARALQALHQDAVFFAKNHALLATAATSLGGVASEQALKLSTHIEQEKEQFRAYFEDLADGLSLDRRDVTGRLMTSDPITAVYGNEGAERVTWGMLSDLSHFSYLMLRHLATSPVPGSTVPLLHATMLQFAQTLNRLSGAAIEGLQRAASQPDGAEG